jgi:hypothetical protein
MAIVTTSAVYRSLKLTLEDIFTDSFENAKKNMCWPKYMPPSSMEDSYVDDLEMAGPGLLTEKPEAQDSAVGTIMEGFPTRYIARTFAMRLLISEEALEDEKYDQVLVQAKRLNYSAIKTQELDAANVLNRATNTSYVGGDGQPLASASHALPGGGTYSNTMTTPFAPSRAAVIIATTAIRKLPGPSGIIDNYMPTTVVFPVDQWAAWEGILNTPKVPESNANEINAVYTMLDIKPVAVPYWTNTTNYLFKTDAPDGLTWKWRRKVRNRTWVDNDAEVMKYSISYRSARGWSNPRGVFFVNA